ncbi:phospholipase D-like protein [Sphingobacterium alimentarium]|uniref:Phospholipase D-like protein n=1 Tax=Sphingobacterium alimentarium TaxID=797292 RepID=A0A4R3VRC1_9SPHI|nr:PLDc N-terminal domain-containing protein [Sphingobacterium alimentarium]TCV07254.1 phospholipase D-like protein [Sphingobacterium alimentarium]
MENLLFLNIGPAEILLIMIWGIFMLIPLTLMIIAFIDLFKRDFKNNNVDRLLIGLMILLAPFLGSLIYIISIRKHYKIKIPAY